MPPKRVKNRYEIKSKIGEGGMGVVYRAYDPPPMNRDVALKTLPPFPDRQAPQLFYRECEVLRSISHPNIVEIFDMGEFEEGGAKMPFFVMPLLMGRTLDELIRNSKHRLTVSRVIDIITQTCRGLQAAHERGLVHRDLKPSNVFVMDDDSVKIIDFGVVHTVDGRSCSNGLQKGTLLYMAPEQVQFKPVTPQSDIFSLGVICYEALTRRQPFRGASEQDVIDAILDEIPPPVSEINPTIPQIISRVVHKAMAKQPWHRFASARELSDVLQRAFRNEPIEQFDPARIQPRLQRAQKAFENGDYQFAEEIVSELEAEGNIDSTLTLLKANVEQGLRQKTIAQLLESAKARFEEDEDPLALQKIQRILELDPNHAAALGLKSKIENRRSERQIDSWIRLADQHVANHAYGHAREALESVLRIRANDARASKMLAELERSEQEYVKLRTEKAQIYKNALDHWKNGDVSEALSQMGLVLELDRCAPDTSSPEGGQTYQSFYNTVRSEHDAINNAYAEARHAVTQDDFEKALATCDRYLTKYPSNALFQALKFDIEEQSRQRLSAYIAEIDRQLEAEPDLETKVDLLQGALVRYPGEAHFERSLKLVSDKRDLVNSIVVRARQHEERGQLNEALGDLEIVRTIYSLYPGLAFEIERLQRKREQRARDAAKAEWIKRIERSLEMGEYSVSLELLSTAQEEFAGDSELAELEKLVQGKRDRADQAQQLVLAGQDLCQQGKFDEGVDSLRKALQLDERNATGKNTLVEALLEKARVDLSDDWRSAESAVQEALDLDPVNTLARNLRSQISDRRSDEEVEQFVAQARKLRGDGDVDGALVEVKKGLAKYTWEARLTALAETLEQEVAQTGRRRARLSDLEEAKTLSRRVSGASADELKSIHERTRAFAVRYPAETEFQSVAAEVDRIVRERAARTTRKQERARSGQPWVLPTIPKQVLWVAGAVVVLVIVLLTAHPWRSKPPAIVLVPVQFQVSPPEATVRIDGKIQKTSQPVPLPVGQHQVDAALEGYESVSKAISITPGRIPTVELTLRPVAQGLSITTPDLEDAEVFLDEQSLGTLEGGTFSNRSLRPGQHNIRIEVLKGQKQQASFSFECKPGAPPKIRLPLAARQSQLLVISSKGNTGFIAGTMLSASVKLDGSALGTLTDRGLELTNLQPGIHQVILGEGARARTMSFESGSSPLLNATIYSQTPLSGKDFEDTGSRSPLGTSPVPLSSGDEVAWRQVKDSSRIADLERFVGEYPNTSHRVEAQSRLEDLYWSIAKNNGTISGYRDYMHRYPNSKYTQSAKYAIAKLDFEAVMSSTDQVVLGDFLSRNSSGEYHDRVAERLDDLMWANTESSDVASLNRYLSRLPHGRHADQARTQIVALTRASVTNADKAKVERTIPEAVHDKSAVLKLVHQYQQAYQNESVDQLKTLWLNMGEQQIRALNDFFGHAQLVKLDYVLNGDPIIAGNNATLRLTQILSYVADAKNNTVSSRTKLIMHLRKESTDSGTSDWRIESIR